MELGSALQRQVGTQVCCSPGFAPLPLASKAPVTTALSPRRREACATKRKLAWATARNRGVEPIVGAVTADLQADCFVAFACEQQFRVFGFGSECLHGDLGFADRFPLMRR